MAIIDVNKTADGRTFSASTSEFKRNEMAEKMNAICTKLTEEDFDAVYTAALIMIYVSEYDRILYSAISNNLFTMYERKKYDLSALPDDTNADELCRFAYLDDFPDRLSQKVSEIDDSFSDSVDAALCKKIIFKINDHVHLVNQQIGHLKLSNEEYRAKFNEHITPILDQVNNAQKSLNDKVENAQGDLTNKVAEANEDIEKFAKEYNAQIISLLGIFTAIAFMVFGAVSEFNNIFSQISRISILKLMILGSVWGICLINLLYVFLFCVGRMTDLNFRSAKKDPHASIFQKYPVVWWSNFIVVSILLVSSVMYFFVYRLGAANRIESMNIANAGVLAFAMVAFLIVMLALYKGFRFLWLQCNPKYDYVSGCKQDTKRSLTTYVLTGVISFVLGAICVLLIKSFL